MFGKVEETCAVAVLAVAVHVALDDDRLHVAIRLRALVLRADQLQRAIGDRAAAGGSGLVLDALRRDLANEPCVLEQLFLPELTEAARV